jgi:tetratricopeptide (TPR) repeat protein
VDVADADLDRLQSLVEKSLLRRSDERYEMLETIREYALAKLAESGRAESLRRRHAEHYLQQASRAEATTPAALRSADTLDQLRPDRDNFRAAFTWATEVGLEELAAGLAIVGVWFTMPRLEWRGMLERALEQSAANAPEQRAKLLDRAAGMAKATGDLRRARELADELLEIARATKNTRAEVSALAHLGDVAALEGDLDNARDIYEREIELLEPLGDVQWFTAVRFVLGVLELMANRLDDAERIFDDALTDARRHGYERLAAKILHGRGDLELERGRFDHAARAYVESARLARPFGETENAIVCLAGLAAVAANERDTARSGRLWGAAEVIAADEGLPLQSDDRRRYERAIAPLRSRVEFSAAEKTGGQLSLDAALDEILGGEPANAPGEQS